MDLATVGGFLFAVVTIAVGAYLEHVTINSILGLSAFLIVVGGTAGATAFSHTMQELKEIPRALKLVFTPPKLDYAGMIDYLVSLAERARRSGLLSLQDDAETASNPLIRRGLMMSVDGTDPEVVQSTLESMSDMKAEELEHASQIFNTAGGYCPTIGIMGTVMGLVTVMGNLSEPETLGPAIAVAFLATLYGVAFANVLLLPLGAKIKAAVKQQSRFDQMIIDGIVAVQSGENPRLLREKLSIYMGEGQKSKEQRSEQGAANPTARTAQGGN